MIKEPILRETFAHTTKAYQSVLEGSSAKQLALYEVLLRNNSGSSANMGIFIRLASASWKIYTYVAVGTTLTDVSSSLQVANAGGTNTTIFNANNDGIYVGSKKKFGLVGINGQTAGTGSPVFTVKYYNGTSFVTLNNFEVFTQVALGQNYIVFAPPVDWAKGGLTGGDSDKYHIQVISTTAPTVKPIINEAWIGKMIAFRTAVSDNGTIQINTADSERPLALDAGEGVLPYFETADNLNTAEISYNNY